MARIESTFFDIGAMDAISGQDTPVHRLDPRAKVLTTLIFIICVVSYDKYEVSGLMPFFVYPSVLIAIGNLPLKVLSKKVLLVSPFALFIGIFNPFLDPDPMTQIGPVTISGGWVSFASIMIRFVLTVGAALVLIATTGFLSVCMALDRMGVPRIFVVQLLFLYRYLFVLVDEGSRMARARALRSFQGRGMGIRVFGSMAGNLLLRTLDRAQRIHLAMLCRGFDGTIKVYKPMRIRGREILFVLVWGMVFVAMRVYNLPQLLGGVFLP